MRMAIHSPLSKARSAAQEGRQDAEAAQSELPSMESLAAEAICRARLATAIHLYEVQQNAQSPSAEAAA